MSESVAISPNFVGNEEDLKKEEIFKDFDINYVPLNNLPVNYFPLNNPVLSKELKTIDMTSVSNPIKTTNFTTEYNDRSKFIKITTDNIRFEVKESFNCELLLVGGGGGGGKSASRGGGGQGGQLIYFQDYKLSKGTYTVQIGSGGAGATVDNGTDGGESKLIKDNKDLFVAKGGKGAKGINGGIGGEYRKGIGGKGGASNSLGLGGEQLNIEGSLINYGYGGDNIGSETDGNNNGNGGNGSGTSKNGFAGKAGVFIIKLKNSEDINKINKVELEGSLNIIDTIASTGMNQEIDVNDNTKKLLKYKTAENANILVLNTDLYCDILLVGGGGGGAWYGGGGGGGAVFEVFNIKLLKGTYTINVGAGGAGGTGGASAGDGNNTLIIFSNSILLGAGGGGGGGSRNGLQNFQNQYQSANYGSGGGATIERANSLEGKLISGGSGGGISGNGGRATLKLTGTLDKVENWNVVQGGGGGAGGNGEDGDIRNVKGGDGGIGKFSQITKTLFGGGGGGGGRTNKQSSGGDGGGGGQGLSGTNETGGGGGGGYWYQDGGKGGDGIVIIRVHKEALEISKNKDILMDLTNRDTKVLNKIKEEFKKKLKDLDNNQKPFNYFNIFPLVILIIIIWIFIILFLLKLLHHFFANVYIYILLTIIIFILLFGSLWFLYTNNDLL